MANILVIDDDKMICEALIDVIGDMGHETACALTLKDGLDLVSNQIFDIIFLDVRLPDGNGLDTLPIFRESPSSPEVIIITGKGDPDGAELAVKTGAWDYIEKPLSVKRITLPLVRALQYRKERTAGKSKPVLKPMNIIGNSPRMKRSLDLLAQAADSEANVLITGETGTGKELFARATHDNSLRKNNNFVVVDCAVLPETLAESTLFGYEKGAYTGADKNQSGLIKQADKGTLFLDEIAELPLSIQRVFLRVLEGKRFRPVGSREEVNSNFRLISATHRNLDDLVESGKFRHDLLFRIRSINIDLPPLKERFGDVKDLTIKYISKLCNRYEIETKGYSTDFMETLLEYGWPGNVRELINALEKAISAAGDAPTLFSMHLPPHIRVQVARSSVSSSPQPDYSINRTKKPVTYPKLRDIIDLTEQQYLQEVAIHAAGNIKEICRISGLSRSRLYGRLKKYDISRK